MVTGLEVAGIDLSLTSTGIARACWDVPGDGVETITRRVQSKGAVDATLLERDARLSLLVATITDEVWDARLVVIESPAYASVSGHAHDRSGLWWCLVRTLLYRGIAVVEVTPQHRMQYATGKGNAGKDTVLAAAVKRYATWDITGNDVADAVVLAAMGARAVGRPIDEPMPQAHLRAMTRVRWPETLTTAGSPT